ncbi:TetR family transcriptional regulator [Streptomyces sp. p1417]|uniref:TetR family transcriptional regulator n=1 Tax=Streptomyces typhae TaxID=2681492 RepID=A0A6L6X471_9ACTN|nr:TetR family transcriptional regulator C-terminal domain-containing protein [Streptomyces typhae]MVO88635.1 TetR family transcriptional regulator [Streptomyces typhae]
MPSSVPNKRIRKSPAARRAEIVAAAASVALTEGLECITLRRVAEELDVRPGLISHYFPVADDLVAEAYGTAAASELEELLPADRSGATPTRHLARLLARTTGEAYDDISRLWLNARHLSRYRPALRARVGVQEAAWRDRMEALIRDGVAQGEFRTADPLVTAIQILVVLDGLGMLVNSAATSEDPPAVRRLPVTTAERELGLAPGTLGAMPDDSAPTADSGGVGGPRGAAR